MKQIDTQEIQLAFNDLMKELNTIKDLNTIADLHKQNADSLAKSIKDLLDVSQKNNQNYLTLVQKTLDKLNKQIEAFGAIRDNIKACTDNIGNKISVLKQEVEKSNRNITKAIASISDESNKMGKDMDAKYTSLKNMVSKTNSLTFWFGLFNMILIIITLILLKLC